MRLLPAVEAQPADVLAADGYIFATPEMLAATSGLMKASNANTAGSINWSGFYDS
ncbi:MAG TPA: hypothetical protein VGC56_17165 [Allosphingosinicella sp.]